MDVSFVKIWTYLEYFWVLPCKIRCVCSVLSYQKTRGIFCDSARHLFRRMAVVPWMSGTILALFSFPEGARTVAVKLLRMVTKRVHGRLVYLLGPLLGNAQRLPDSLEGPAL